MHRVEGAVVATLFSIATLVVPAFGPGNDRASACVGTATAEAPLYGTITFKLDPFLLDALGWSVETRGELDNQGTEAFPVFAITEASVGQARKGSRTAMLDANGPTHMSGAMRIGSARAETLVGNLAVARAMDGTWIVTNSIIDQEPFTVFELTDVVRDISPKGAAVRMTADLVVSEGLAVRLGESDAAGMRIGILDLEAVVSDLAVSMAIHSAPESSETGQGDEGSVAALAGPDVIVGDLIADQNSLTRWGKLDDITAYSFGTISCNIGNAPLNWLNGGVSAEHPVIAQNIYRLKGGRFEQIGLSWLKHGFFALSETLCSGPNGCMGFASGDHLGVGCSDPYSAALNGGSDTTFPYIANLGPRYEVNATTGEFPFPFIARNPPCNTVICRRLQIHDADLDPEMNPSARYFVEGQYVTPDDAAAGNSFNNASYREVNVLETAENIFSLSFNFARTTRQKKPAIQAWGDVDTGVRVVRATVENDGWFWLGYKVSPLMPGLWHYEYAVQNMNSDRSASSFTVPLPKDVVISNIGFHDIHDHSMNNANDAPYDTTDWAAVETVVEGVRTLVWQTLAFEPSENANALRWGSLYNFRFDADVAPAEGEVALGLFKSGTPAALAITSAVPGEPFAILVSDPPTEAIDARQPHELDGTSPAGWSEFRLTLNVLAAGLTGSDFVFTQTGGPPLGPDILGAIAADETTLRVVLTGPISVAARSRLKHFDSDEAVDVAYLPGDVNADGTTDSTDVMTMLDALNEAAQTMVPLLPNWSIDIDRSEQFNLMDLIRLIDLQNGAEAFDTFLGVSLPPSE